MLTCAGSGSGRRGAAPSQVARLGAQEVPTPSQGLPAEQKPGIINLIVSQPGGSVSCPGLRLAPGAGVSRAEASMLTLPLFHLEG